MTKLAGSSRIILVRYRNPSEPSNLVKKIVLKPRTKLVVRIYLDRQENEGTIHLRLYSIG